MTIPVLFGMVGLFARSPVLWGREGEKARSAALGDALQFYGKSVILSEERMMAKLVRKHPTGSVAASAFAKRFGHYRVQAMKAAVPITNFGEVTGYFVAKDEYEKLRRLQDEVRSMLPSLNQKSHAMENMGDEFARSLAGSRMSERFADLNALLDD